MTPPGGPRDWSPPETSNRRSKPERAGRTVLRGEGHVEGLGWAWALTATALVVGVVALLFALLAPY